MLSHKSLRKIIFKGGYRMALTNEELQDIINGLSPEERKQLLSQLGRQVDIDNITNITDPVKPDEPPEPKRKTPEGKIYCCVHCGSANYKKIGFTNKGLQRYLCKDCKKSFSENHGDSLRYSHLSEHQWRIIIRGLIYDHSLPMIASDANISVSTAWTCRAKIKQAIATMYGYNDLFTGCTQADEFYCRASFKGKRDPEFFIYTLRRMPRHNRNYAEKVEYLQNAGLYSKLQAEDPAYLDYLLSEESDKRKRGISNDQICILTLVDNTGKLYLEPVSVGRLEKAMAKAKLKPKLVPDKSNVVVTDDHNAYVRAFYGTKAKHEVIPSGKHTNGKYNLAKVDSVHSQLRAYMERYKGRAFTTKYLDLNLMLFWWLFKYKEFNIDDKVDALYSIMNDQIPDIDIRERVNQVTLDELQNREITLDTKGEFPTKL